MELLHLKVIYSMLYPSKSLEVLRFYKEYKGIVINSVEFTLKLSRSQRSSVISARWPGVIGIDRLGESPLRVGLVKSFIENEVTMANSDGSSSSSQTHILMNIQWHENHPRQDYINSSVILTCTEFDHDSCASFMPVSRVFSRCAVSPPSLITGKII